MVQSSFCGLIQVVFVPFRTRFVAGIIGISAIALQIIGWPFSNFTTANKRKDFSRNNRARVFPGALAVFLWLRRGMDVSSPAIRATKVTAYFGDKNVTQMSRRLNYHLCSHTPSAINVGAKPCLNVATWRRERSNRAFQNLCKSLQVNLLFDEFDHPISLTLLSPM